MKTNEVYKITNIITNKIYIGITNQGSHIRYLHHLYESRIGELSPIHKSIAKYGKENFILEVIDFADNYEDLKEKEKYYIKLYNSNNRNIGYNLTEGGDGTFGRMHSNETKEKIRLKAIGRKASDETKAKMSESKKGHKLSDKTIEVLTNSNINRSKSILQYDTNGNFIAEYKSISEASKISGVHRSSITNQINNKLKLNNYKNNKPKFIWKVK